MNPRCLLQRTEIQKVRKKKRTAEGWWHLAKLLQIFQEEWSKTGQALWQIQNRFSGRRRGMKILCRGWGWGRGQERGSRWLKRQKVHLKRVEFMTRFELILRLFRSKHHMHDWLMMMKKYLWLKCNGSYKLVLGVCKLLHSRYTIYIFFFQYSKIISV